MWDRATLPPGKFAEYQALHAKDAGRVTRTQRTFDLMEAWVQDGMAALVEADEGGRAVAFALLMIYKNGAYYGSGCKDPDLGPVAASHLVQWTAITWLKAHGIAWYDVGLQQFGPQWFDLPSDKNVSISAFKRGFGGDTMPLVTAECFYSSDLLEETFARRVRGYLAASGRLTASGRLAETR